MIPTPRSPGSHAGTNGLVDPTTGVPGPNLEVVTADGWKAHEQLSVEEQVLTLNHETGLSEWQPLLAVNIWDVVNEPMVGIRGRGHSSVTTLNHRWPTLSTRPHRAARDRVWDTSTAAALSLIMSLRLGVAGVFFGGASVLGLGVGVAIVSNVDGVRLLARFW
jgi:hypothetical protein